MRPLLVLALGLALNGCCCSVESVRRMENGHCFVDRYNCNVSALTFMGSDEVPCTCEFQACTTDSDCTQAATCQQAVACDGGRFPGDSIACSPSNTCGHSPTGQGSCSDGG